jgi:hypothetical protein
MTTDTCNLQNLKSLTIFQISRSDNDPVRGAYVITEPFFEEVREEWRQDDIHQFMSEVLYTHPNGQIRLVREFQKWVGFDLFHKPVILEIIDTLAEPITYNKAIVNMVDSIPGRIVVSVDPRSRYDILYEDVECRLYTHIQLVDDPNADEGTRQIIDIYLEVVPYGVFPNTVTPKIPCPELGK